MKRNFVFISVFFALVLACSSFFNLTKTRAEDANYLRVTNSETPLFSDRGGKLLCYLPYTYYVCALEMTDGFYHVEISVNGCRIDGFVPEGYLYNDGLSVENPYADTVIKTCSNCIMFAEDFVTANRYIFKDRELRYVGNINYENEYYFLVFYNGDLGYVKESSVYPFSVPNHPNPLTFIKEETIEPSNVPSNDFFSLKIIIIVCLLFAGLTALAFAISKRKKPDRTEYYDQNDFR